MEITVVTAIVAVTQLVKKLAPSVSGWLTVVVAAVIGALAGYFGVEGLTVAAGLTAGLSAVGVHTVASQIGPTETGQ